MSDKFGRRWFWHGSFFSLKFIGQLIHVRVHLGIHVIITVREGVINDDSLVDLLCAGGLQRIFGFPK